LIDWLIDPGEKRWSQDSRFQKHQQRMLTFLHESIQARCVLYVYYKHKTTEDDWSVHQYLMLTFSCLLKRILISYTSIRHNTERITLSQKVTQSHG
jgi:hypothetical protein